MNFSLLMWGVLIPRILFQIGWTICGQPVLGSIRFGYIIFTLATSLVFTGPCFLAYAYCSACQLTLCSKSSLYAGLELSTCMQWDSSCMQLSMTSEAICSCLQFTRWTSLICLTVSSFYFVVFVVGGTNQWVGLTIFTCICIKLCPPK